MFRRLGIVLVTVLTTSVVFSASPQPSPKPVPGVPSVGKLTTRARALAAISCTIGTSNLTATLTITPPTTDSNGNPLTLPITSYNVYQGTTSGGETKVASITSTTDTITGLLPGTTYYWFVTAVDANGEGLHSNEGCKGPFPSTAPPGAPGLGIS